MFSILLLWPPSTEVLPLCLLDSPPDSLFSHAASIIDPYVPPEGDARMTSLSKEGLKQRMEKLKQTAASQLAYVPPFQLVCSAEVLLSFVLHFN